MPIASSQQPERWPIWATEPVAISQYDPAWSDAGDQQCRELQHLLAPWATGNIEHVGSTAIPGLAAKPIIDLQAPVDDLEVAEAVASVLAPHDWHYVPPELDRRDHRRFYVRVADDRRVAHLHLMTLRSARWHQQIAFRDALREDPELVHAYASLKTQLAHHHRHDREAYSAAKQAFVQQVLDRTTQTGEL